MGCPAPAHHHLNLYQGQCKPCLLLLQEDTANGACCFGGLEIVLTCMVLTVRVEPSTTDLCGWVVVQSGQVHVSWQIAQSGRWWKEAPATPKHLQQTASSGSAPIAAAPAVVTEANRPKLSQPLSIPKEASESAILPQQHCHHLSIPAK